MRTTIDKAGRVVIPAAIRERAGLAPGSEVEISADGLGIRIERVAAGPQLIRVGRRLVARPTVARGDRPLVDVAALVEDERRACVSGARVVVTDNRRHFRSALRYDLRVETPDEFLSTLKKGK